MSFALPDGHTFAIRERDPVVGCTRGGTLLSAPSPPREPSSIIFALSAPIDRADVPALCTRLRAALEASDALFVVCDVGELTKPDAVTIDALARLQLTARR